MSVLTLLVTHFAASSLMHERALPWHYRRDDPGGLVFVLFLLAVFLWMMWSARGAPSRFCVDGGSL